MAGKGRPGPASKLTDEVREEIAAQLVAGNTLEDAALKVGVNRVTIQTWLRKGRAAAEKVAEGKRITAADRPYIDLLEAEEQARATLRVNLQTGLVAAAAKGDTRAAMWLLEKLYPEDFDRRKGKTERPGTGRPVGAVSAPDRQAREKPRPGILRAVEGGKK